MARLLHYAKKTQIGTCHAGRGVRPHRPRRSEPSLRPMKERMTMSAQGIVYNIQRMSTQDGPGLRTTIFLKGCPLSCLWCSNPESQASHPQLMFFPNLCTGCGRCREACDYGAIFQKASIYDRDFSRCTNCGRCAEVCPTTAACMSGKSYSVE